MFSLSTVTKHISIKYSVLYIMIMHISFEELLQLCISYNVFQCPNKLIFLILFRYTCMGRKTKV